MAEALYGPGGFYRRERPGAHFRTSVHASPLFATALRRLATRVDAALGWPDPFELVDVGAGDGGLLEQIGQGAPARWRLQPIQYGDPLPDRVAGVLIANELLDNVPCEVVELTPDGPRLVREDGSWGGPPAEPDLAWLARWWPLAAPGDRAEVGRSRDAAWAELVGRLDRGLALAIDYAHDRSARPPYGTLLGYRSGRAVRPVADGSCDLTAHVALDACAAAATAQDTRLTTQRAALRALGLSGSRPSYAGDPAGYLRELELAGAAAELLDPAGLGGFGWLLQARGVPRRRILWPV